EHTSELQSLTNSRMPSSAWSSDVCSRSEEHTSELQSLTNLVCRLLLEKYSRCVALGSAGRCGSSTRPAWRPAGMRARARGRAATRPLEGCRTGESPQRFPRRDGSGSRRQSTDRPPRCIPQSRRLQDWELTEHQPGRIPLPATSITTATTLRTCSSTNFLSL